MIEEENQTPEPEELIEELKIDEDIDLDASLGQLMEETKTEQQHPAADPQPPTESEAPAIDQKAVKKAESEAAAANKKIEELMSQVMALKQQLDERNSQYMRLYADFENYRKRMEREKEDEETVISSKILKKFLPVVDDFERAQSQIQPKTDAESLIHNSYQSVYKQLVKCLKEAGVLRMTTLRQEFDPNFHEAIAQEPTTEFEDGTVMDELRPGYLLGDRILRHALVKVAAALTTANVVESPQDATDNPTESTAESEPNPEN